MLALREWDGLPKSPGGRDTEGMCGYVTLTGALKVSAVRDAVGGEFCVLQHVDNLLSIGSSHLMLLLSRMAQSRFSPQC